MLAEINLISGKTTPPEGIARIRRIHELIDMTGLSYENKDALKAAPVLNLCEGYSLLYAWETKEKFSDVMSIRADFYDYVDMGNKELTEGTATLAMAQTIVNLEDGMDMSLTEKDALEKDASMAAERAEMFALLKETLAELDSNPAYSSSPVLFKRLKETIAAYAKEFFPDDHSLKAGALQPSL